MSTNSITECAVAIYLEGADLRELGLHVPVSTADARTLIVNAMRTSGRQPWGQMEVEMFTYADSVLLLARPSDRAATCFRFDDLEDLIAGAACLPEDTQSTLIWLNGNYYLFLGVQEVGHTGALYEFGHPYRCSAGQAAHMAEHGKVLMANRAAFLLNRYFHK